MIRAFVLYGGREFLVAGRSADEICDEIERGLSSGAPFWLHATTTEGRYQETRLLIQPGVDIAVQHIDEQSRDQASERVMGSVGITIESAADDQVA